MILRPQTLRDEQQGEEHHKDSIHCIAPCSLYFKGPWLLMRVE